MTIPLRRTTAAATAILGLAVLAACTSTPTTAPKLTATTTTPSTTSPTTFATPAEVQQPVAITHIHAVARDPKTDELLLATHEGLFRQVDGELRQNGPIIDLMSFAVGPDGTYYASGHPGVDVDLPQPVGLLTSTDAGRTWQVASRGGESDFHALAVGPKSVTGFDGALRTSTDRRTWTTHSIAAPPRALAAAPTSGTLLATTSAGLLISGDDGGSWRKLASPEAALLVAWADERTIVTATTGGQLATSNDAGATWTLHPKSIGAAEALFAQHGTDGQLEIIVVVDGKVLRITEAGETAETLVS